jgi:hypothetical protein
MKTTELCRGCGGTMVLENTEKCLFHCRKCNSRFVRLEDGAEGRFFAANANGRAFSATGLSTRDGLYSSTSTRTGTGTDSDPVRYDPCEGYFYGDGRPGREDPLPAVGGQEFDRNENRRPDGESISLEEAIRNEVDQRLFDPKNAESIAVFEEIQQQRTANATARICELING